MEMFDILVWVLLFLPILLSFIFLRKQKRRPKQRRANLPPGSNTGDETLQLYSQDPNVFFASKQKRYGEIFKTHALECPSVMLASPEAAKFVLVTHSHLFKPTYPKSKELMIGPSALFFQQGDYHSRFRKLVQSSLSPYKIGNFIPDIEAISISMLNSWTVGSQTINTFNEMKKLSFDVGIVSIFGHLDKYYKEELKKNYSILVKGYNSFPTDIPGTLYNDAVLARKRLSKISSKIISERKGNVMEKNLLHGLMSSKDEKGESLTDDQIADNIIGVLFAAQDTTASVLTWILKFLHDDPKLLETVKAEQQAIYESNNAGNRSLTWTQTRNMVFTYKVIQESLRMASIISFPFREAVADVEYKGYLVPKGWKALPLFRCIHHNPEFFPDPHKFDPSRFEVAPKPNTFMPFGNGVHACPGNELAKLEMLILLHHLVTKFRWELLGSQTGIQYSPFPVPQHGLPARFWKENHPSNKDNKMGKDAHNSISKFTPSSDIKSMIAWTLSSPTSSTGPLCITVLM